MTIKKKLFMCSFNLTLRKFNLFLMEEYELRVTTMPHFTIMLPEC